MKHGDQEKRKAAKAVTEASAKGGKAVAAKSSKGGQSAGKAGSKGENGSAKKQQAGPEAKGSSPVPKAGAQKGSASSSTPASQGGKARAAEEPVDFTNPVIASAFKRAVQKYPNAFRKLTD